MLFFCRCGGLVGFVIESNFCVMWCKFWLLVIFRDDFLWKVNSKLIEIREKDNSRLYLRFWCWIIVVFMF